MHFAAGYIEMLLCFNEPGHTGNPNHSGTNADDDRTSRLVAPTFVALMVINSRRRTTWVQFLSKTADGLTDQKRRMHDSKTPMIHHFLGPMT